MNNTLKKHPPILLTLLSSLFLSIAWYIPYGSLLLFVGFVPLWILEQQISESTEKRKRLKIFAWAYLSFFIWNVATTWWVYNSTLVGVIVMLILNSLVMTIPFVFFSFTKKVLNRSFGLFSFLLYWLSFEYLHLHWELNWPWLTLGNGFSLNPEWVQWYEVTGALGGTLWVILINICVFYIWTSISKHNKRVYTIYGSLVLIVPIIISYIIYYTYEEKGTDFEVVVMQPNIDPFQEKFKNSENFIPFDKQLERFIALSEKKITKDTKLVVWPETAIDDALTEKGIEQYSVYKKINEFVTKHPNASLLTGITSVEWYDSKKTATAQLSGSNYYDVYNTAMYINPKKTSPEFYHKRKLVPAVEAMPYPALLEPLSKMMIDLGGTSGGYGKQKEAQVFDKDGIKIAPLICFESVFGDLITEYEGANIFCIITNDGWWGNTPGHKQHMHFASLRAIEVRKDIARSANTGISCFVNQRGDIRQKTKYWEQDVIKTTLKANNTKTIYSKYGDYVGRLACFIGGFFLLSAFVKKITKN